MNTVNKILGFAASSSRSSINKQLVTHAADVLQNITTTELDINILDLNDFEMPIYSIDREQETGIPNAAKSFYSAIGQADALLISYAEHNGNYSAAYKNIFDWCSRIDGKVFQSKPMLVMAASPGGGGAGSVLKLAIESAPFFGADIRGSLSVGNFHKNFDKDTGQLNNPDISSELVKQLSGLGIT